MPKTATSPSSAGCQVREIGHSGGLTVMQGGRGRPERVTQRLTEALAPVMEGIALADDVATAAERIALAVAAGSPMAAVHEAQRLAYRAQQYRAEFRRLAGALDGPKAA